MTEVYTAGIYFFMKQFRAKTFKSGNSIALRLPKAAGFIEGDEVTVIPHADGSFSIIKVSRAKAAFMALPGRLSNGFMAGGRGDIEQPERNWSSGSSSAEAA